MVVLHLILPLLLNLAEILKNLAVRRKRVGVISPDKDKLKMLNSYLNANAIENVYYSENKDFRNHDFSTYTPLLLSSFSAKGLEFENVIVFFAANKANLILPHVGKLRTKLGLDFKLTEENAFRFCWITDFPMYVYDENEKKIDFNHNPFSMPQGGMKDLLEKKPLEIYAWQYDVVCNGYELSSGAIRNHDPEIMYKAFEIVGYDRAFVDNKFGGMINAFKYGAPPHGGMAPGIDRIVMLLANETAIRDVIAFPLSQSVEDLMMKAPSEATAKQLKELHLKLDLPPVELHKKAQN